ncbi:hypothetical protein [Aquimarina litoralis]|uniref:hypothetical protein n=1 Tax=Aquimarina litoralis TaxID=584605 RepID=UPI001C581227|nr:hypothetical protein [Aquimarina litoralis]MBW1299011.1 hypothetical protein [Aquimarina litoralis]
MTRIFLLLFLTYFSGFGQESHRDLKTYFSEDIKVNEENIPLDPNQSYAPKELNINVLGLYMEPMREPLLFNKPYKDEIFRFTWLRSFHNPIIISFIRNNNEYYLTWKELDKEAVSKEAQDTVKELSPKSENDFLKLMIKHTKNHTKKVDIHNWYRFKKLVNESNYWAMSSKEDKIGLDGSFLYLEYATDNGYKIVEKWNPDEEGKFYRLFEYLIKFTNIKIPKNEKY